MTHLDFRRRFIAALPPVPANLDLDLDLDLDEFVDFDSLVVSVLAPQDATFLLEHGLPRNASPFLHFEAYSSDQMRNSEETFCVPGPVFPIGQNGSGDVVAIDLISREVVYFNHDASNLRVFINSSLKQFTDTLCIYQEHLLNSEMTSCLAAIATIDAKAANPGTMWYAEVLAEVTGD